MSWPYKSRPGEFSYPRELPELPVDRKKLLELGKAGVLLTQFEIDTPNPLPRYQSANTTFRYHVPYLQVALESVDTGLPVAQLREPLTAFAATQTEFIAAAINRYYDGLFAAAEQQTGRPYLSLEQALTATGLSYPKLQPHVSATKVNGRPVWTPENLAGVFGWNVPGSPETSATVLTGLSELAVEHAIILPRPEDRSE